MIITCDVPGKKVYKFATGQEIPEGAIYLTTLVEENPRLVWHYFLVDVEEEENES